MVNRWLIWIPYIFTTTHNKIDFETKETMVITISNWYTEYR